VSSYKPDHSPGVDHAPLEGGVDLAPRREDDGAPGPGDDLAAEAPDAHLQAPVVGDGIDPVDLKPSDGTV